MGRRRRRKEEITLARSCGNHIRELLQDVLGLWSPERISEGATGKCLGALVRHVDPSHP